MRGLALLALLAAAPLSAPPVGPLPKGPHITITTPARQYVSFALRHGPAGFVWRGARRSDATIVRPITEADVGDYVVMVYRALRPGRTNVVFALTKGETPKAYRAMTYTVIVTPPSTG